MSDGLTVTYRRARQLVPDNWSDPDAEHLHDLRRRVVEHRHQMDLVEPLWPRLGQVWSAEAQRLRNQLGACQDLEMLSHFTAPHQPLARWRSRLAPLIESRRAGHLKNAARLASRLFAEKPKAFRRRIDALWSARGARKKAKRELPRFAGAFSRYFPMSNNVIAIAARHLGECTQRAERLDFERRPFQSLCTAGALTMDANLTDTIDMHGHPLAFKLRQGSASPLVNAGRDVVKIEARQMALHQKECVAADGADASAWRLTSDEGKHLKGTDLAPFPLGFFNAGIQVDLAQQIRRLAAERNIRIDGLSLKVVNHYWLTGSFIHGTGEGHAEVPDIEVSLDSPASAAEIEALVHAAMDASPAIAYLRTPMNGNTFALYINGRRRPVDGMENSSAADADDPYRVYTSAPAPARRRMDRTI